VGRVAAHLRGRSLRARSKEISACSISTAQPRAAFRRGATEGGEAGLPGRWDLSALVRGCGLRDRLGRVTEIERVLWALEAAGVRYLVVGGVAVVLHGPPRFTADLDLAIALDPDNVRAAFAALATLGYGPRVPVSPEVFADARERRRLVEEEGMVVLSFASSELRALSSRSPRWTSSRLRPSPSRTSTAGPTGSSRESVATWERGWPRYPT